MVTNRRLVKYIVFLWGEGLIWNSTIHSTRLPKRLFLPCSDMDELDAYMNLPEPEFLKKSGFTTKEGMRLDTHSAPTFSKLLNNVCFVDHLLQNMKVLYRLLVETSTVSNIVAKVPQIFCSPVKKSPQKDVAKGVKKKAVKNRCR